MTPPYKRLAQPLIAISSHYDVVVVGSGYGGAVAASRLSRAGKRVCVLERGKEFLPGEFPDTIGDAIPEFQIDSARGHIGSRTGLYDMHVHRDMNVLVGCGLGGTSLINANVSLQAEQWVLQDEAWPQALREEGANAESRLHRCVAKARSMLKPTPYPEITLLKKLDAQRKTAEQIEGEFSLPPINVNFEAVAANHAGVAQPACDNCGDCVSGCNVGAKNTTAMNYLPDAVNHGAEIFCEAKVSHVERFQQDGREQWRVYYSAENLGRKVFAAPPLFVVADTVVIAAGTLGSNEIMLRSREKGLSVSTHLGEHFTGNGDVLAFAYNNDQKINGVGFGANKHEGRDPVGPCITTLIDDRPGKGDKGMVVEEGSLPGLMAPLLPAIFSAASASIGEDTDRGFLDRVREKARALESIFRDSSHGAVNHTQTYLVMSHDDGKGKIQLSGNRPEVVWPNVGKQPVFAEISQRLKQATTALGGTYIRNPMWDERLGHELVTVHPLGGCGMADSAERGVVNERCQVFSAEHGQAVYDRLYICDGSVIPRSLGVNPLLTITALAERACELMIEDRGWQSSPVLADPPLKAPARLGIQFTETMRGHMSLDAGLDFAAAEADGEQQNQPFAFTLTVRSDDLDTMLAEDEHRARMLGTVDAPALSDKPLMAVDGQFQLFVRDPNHIGRRLMIYRMLLADEAGKHYFFHGYKSVEDNKGLDVWADTTTLFITLYDGDSEQAPLLGRGILHIAAVDFAKQMTTMTALNASYKTEAMSAVAKFARFFAGAVARTYGGPLAPFEVYDPSQPARPKRPLRVCEPRYYPVTTDDGVELLLTRYCSPECEGEVTPVMLAHGLGVSSRIFSLDTIETNLLEYLYEHNLDVWLLDFRASIELPVSGNCFSADDIARYDYPAAVAKILSVTGEDNIQVVAHCFGGCTFSLAMLAGLKGVGSAVISQVATHYEGTVLGKLKTGLHLPGLLEKLGVSSLTAYRDSNANWLEQLYDHALRLYPQEFEELTNNPIDKRIAFMYGQLWELDQLNQATHDNLHELFGVANIESFQQLAMMMRMGHAVDKHGNEVYLPHAERMNIPIRFIHGAENQTFLPKGSEEAIEFLSAINGEELYDLKLIPNYGHIDCIFGRDAVRDVYPLILEHLLNTA